MSTVPKQINMLSPSSNKEPDPCPFSVLGLKQGVTTKQIRRAYKRRMRFAGKDDELKRKLTTALDRALRLSSSSDTILCDIVTENPCCPCSNRQYLASKPVSRRDLWEVMALTGAAEFVHVYPASDYDMCDHDEDD